MNNVNPIQALMQQKLLLQLEYATEKEAQITPINEHWTSETMEREHMEWILRKKM